MIDPSPISKFVEKKDYAPLEIGGRCLPNGLIRPGKYCVGEKKLIHQTRRELGRSLADDVSENADLSVQYLSGLGIRDWNIPHDQVDEQPVEGPVEIDEVIQSNDSGDKLINAEYVKNVKNENCQ